MIFVVGAGSVGLYLSSQLARNGAPVSLILKNGRSSEFSGKKIEVQGIDRFEIGVPTVEWGQIESVTEETIILVLVKAPDLASVLGQVRSRFSPANTKVILGQNGLGILDEAREILGPEFRLARMLSWFGVLRRSPTSVEKRGEGIIDLGPASEWIVAFGDQLRSAGLDVRLGPDPELMEWKKSLLNLGINALCGVRGLPNGAVLEDRKLQAEMEEILFEALEVAEAQGVDLDRVKEIASAWEGVKNTAANFNSTVQDLRAGRKTEIPWMNGRIAEWGRSLGIPTPFNEKASQSIEAAEAKNRSV